MGVNSTGMLFTSVENFIRAVNLSDDAIYGFQLSVTNSVGTVSTSLSQEICKLVLPIASCLLYTHDLTLHIILVLGTCLVCSFFFVRDPLFGGASHTCILR